MRGIVTYAVFAVAATFPCSVWAAPGWIYGTPDGTAMYSELNILRGLLPSAQSGSFGQEGTSGVGVLTDGTVLTAQDKSKNCGIPSNASLEYALTNAATAAAGVSIAEFRIHSCWGNADRSTIHLDAVKVKTVSSNEWASLKDSTCTSGGTSTRSAIYKDPDGDVKPLATGVTDIRIEFGAQQNGYVGYTEIELLSVPASALVVWGDPVEAADEGGPAYGVSTGLANGATVVRTAPSAAQYDRTAYECAGHVLETYGADGWTGGQVTNTDPATSCSYVQSGTETKRLTWIWDVAGYALDIVMPTIPLGTVSVDKPAGPYGKYAPGTVVTLQATPGEGVTFSRWFGDTPGGNETTASLAVTMDGNKTLCPYFGGSWVSAGAGKITDGYWTNAISGTTIGWVSWHNGVVTTLDFSKPYTGGSFTAFGSNKDNGIRMYDVILPDTVASIPNDAFRGTLVKSMVLPAKLTTLGARAFYQAGSLTNITPCLPATVTSIGLGCFAYTSLQGDLVISNSAVTRLPVDGTEGGCFYGARLTSVDLTRTSITAFEKNVFRSCPNLKTVRLPKTFTTFGSCAFFGTGGVKAMYMPGDPPTSVSSDAFGFGDLACRLYVTKGSAAWTQYFEANPAKYVALTAAEKTAFASKFPGERVPGQKVKLLSGPWFYLCHIPINGSLICVR